MLQQGLNVRQSAVYSTVEHIVNFVDGNIYTIYQTIPPPPTGPSSFVFHWRIQGGAVARAPPTGSISFIFAYVFAEKCTHRRLAPPTGRRPPNGKSWIRHCFRIHFCRKAPVSEVNAPNVFALPQREILDPQLQKIRL